jgi:hypothetical protein
LVNSLQIQEGGCGRTAKIQPLNCKNGAMHSSMPEANGTTKKTGFWQFGTSRTHLIFLEPEANRP